jgi:SAM-dependent methyltransferase
MEASEYRRLAAIEDSHWWYRATHELVIEAVSKGLTLAKPRLDLNIFIFNILDAGCGTGGLTKKLETFGSVIGLDISPLALKLAKKHKLKLIEGSVNNLPFSSRRFDLIVSVSVLYHQRVDDLAAIKEFYRALKPKGKLILILPAFSWIYGSHDKAVHTRKRYTLSEAADLVVANGFKPVESRYIFSFLFPVFLVKRLVEKAFSARKQISDLEILPGFLNSFLFWLCRVEWRLGDFVRLPWGSSLLVMGEKK